MTRTTDAARVDSHSPGAFGLGHFLSLESVVNSLNPARAIGVSQQAIHAYELGERRTSALVLAKIAKAFGVPVEELIGLAKPARVLKGRLSPRCIRHAERLQALSKTQQRFVIRIIDTLEDSNLPANADTSFRNSDL
jgi:transcriptional regulator with XRE-family HTH domain